MEEKKEIKISLGTFICLFIILILIFALIVTYYFGFIDKKTETNTTYNNALETSDVKENTEVNLNNKTIYEKCEEKLAGVTYRRDTGSSSGFFIKNGILYSGEENMPETQSVATGINGTAKYVVPINKQIGKTVVLTNDGKLYINVEENGIYGNKFKAILPQYKFVEIIELAGQDELLFLSENENIYYINGTLYLNLNSNNTPTTNITADKTIYEKCEEKLAGVTYRRDTGSSSGFFIKNGILYSGEENMTETQSVATGIDGTTKYVVPINKQTGKTVVLANDGKLYINVEENGIYGNKFETILPQYKFVEIIELAGQDEFLFLSENENIYYVDGTVYLNLNSNNT